MLTTRDAATGDVVPSHNFVDLTGKRFGSLVVSERAENTPSGRARWVCQCDCGQECTVTGSSMTCGDTSSCGCLHRAGLSARNTARRKPGQEVSYASAHLRVRRSKGSASSHPCIDCGLTASDWSLRRDACGVFAGPAVNGSICRYSPDPSDYEPRCRKCHRAYDGAIGTGAK